MFGSKLEHDCVRDHDNQNFGREFQAGAKVCKAPVCTRVPLWFVISFFSTEAVFHPFESAIGMQKRTIATIIRPVVHHLFVIFLSALIVQPSVSLTSLITGANGYVGRAVVHELVRSKAFDDVCCLVRSHRVGSEQRYWGQVEGGSVVRVVPYDMMDGGITVRNALESCAPGESSLFVFHIASVFGPTVHHKQTALENVKGTEDLVREITRRDNCKLILTSSMAAVRGPGQHPLNGKFFTQQDWNSISQLGANWGASYQWSKMQSELRATELCREKNIPITVLNPSFVFGPYHSSSVEHIVDSSSFSLSLVRNWLWGESPVQSRLCVDVRDVARAHLQAALRSNTQGQRYLLSTEARVPSSTIAEWLREICHTTGRGNPVKIHCDTDFTGGAIPIGDKEVESIGRLRIELGLELRPVRETITEMAYSILLGRT